MAISDEIFVLGLGFVGNYVMIYRRNYFVGNILFMIMSIAMAMHSTDELLRTMSWVFMFMAIVSFIYDLYRSKYF